MKIPMALWPRLMPLLDEALALPGVQREAWLQRLDLDKDTAVALRQLLDERRELEGGAFMAALPKLDLSGAVSPSSGATGRVESGTQVGLFAGDTLGPYRLIRPLGQGGMSVVWLAEREDGQIRRPVALKMPHAGPGQALLAERLRRERDILASLEHRHIARLYDVGTCPQGLPYMALEYIEGQPLLAYCDAHRLSLHARLNLFLQVLSAVQYAHTKLILHRDLKPSNILVNEQGEVKLLDFGIAKLLRDGETGAVAASTELTQHNGHVLTPDYAAPEQIAGQALTTASDVYALGVILFELLTGQRPYRLPRGTRGALEEAILATDARRPSQVWLDADVQTQHPTAVTLSDLAAHFHSNPRRLHQLLKGDLDVIVLTALQKQAVRRYATAEAFAQDIQHHLAKEPIAAQPDSRWYRARKYAQRHAWALSAVAAVVAALSVGLGVALWQAEQARQEAAKANAIKDFLVGLFENGDVEQPDALRKRQQTVEQLLVNSARALGTQLKDQPRVRVELQGVVGGLLHNLAITDEAIALRKQRVAQLEAMGAPVAELAQAWRDLADSHEARGETVETKASLERGLALCRASSMQPLAVCHGLQVMLGAQLTTQRDAQGAIRLIQPALYQLRRDAPESAQLAEALVAMGDVLTLRGDADASYALYQEAMAVRSRVWGVSSVRLAHERYLLAMSLAQVGRMAQALTELEAAHQTMVRALGRAHVKSAAIELQWGRLRLIVGEPGLGQTQIAHASRVILDAADTVDARTQFEAQRAMAESALFDGRLTEAGPLLERAWALHAPLRSSLPRDGRLEIERAWYLDDVGQHDQARALLEAEKTQFQAELGASHPFVQAMEEAITSSHLAQEDWARAWQRLGADRPEAAQSVPAQTRAAVLMGLGRFREAEPLLRQVMQEQQAVPRRNQYRLGIYGVNDQMARLKMGLGQAAEARPYFERAIQALSDGYPYSPYLAFTRANYGLCLLALGDRSGALKQSQAAGKAFSVERTTAQRFRRPYVLLQERLQEGQLVAN